MGWHLHLSPEDVLQAQCQSCVHSVGHDMTTADGHRASTRCTDGPSCEFRKELARRREAEARNLPDKD